MAINEKLKEKAEDILEKRLRIEECYPKFVDILNIPHTVDRNYHHTLRDRCPSKDHTDVLPSFGIKKEGQFANCFGCSFGAGGVLDLYVKLNREYNNTSYSYIQGIYDLAREFNIRIPTFTYDPYERLRNNIRKDNDLEISDKSREEFKILKLNKKIKVLEGKLKEISINDYYKFLFLRVQYLDSSILSMNNYVGELEEAILQCRN